MNTYGVGSLDSTSWGLISVAAEKTHRIEIAEARALVALGRVYNLAMGILGYIPVTSFVSGLFRASVGVAMFAASVVIDSIRESLNCPPEVSVALSRTAVAQMVRGVCEACGPLGGWYVNAALDIGTTCYHLRPREAGYLAGMRSAFRL